MCEHQHIAWLQVRFDVLLVDIRLILIRCQDHDDVSGLGSVCRIHDLQTGLFRLCTALGARAKTNDDIDAAVMQVQRMRMSLRAITNDGHRLAFQ